uniref:Globin family profile domain-containing protein n=1 Tax=Romanomermis culicivorax TaxID=13658 RepID=A0A915JSD8_ROMCU
MFTCTSFERSSDGNLSGFDFLTPCHRKQIVKSWSAVSNRIALGQIIYLQIFMHKPSLKSLFQFREVPVDQLKDDPYFERQCALLTGFLNSVVGFIRTNDYARMSELCHRIGRRHAFISSVNFEPDWWRLFASSTIDSMMPFLDQHCCSASNNNNGHDVNNNGCDKDSPSRAPLTTGKVAIRDPYLEKNPRQVVLGTDPRFAAWFMIGVHHGKRLSRSKSSTVQAWEALLMRVVELMSDAFYQAKMKNERAAAGDGTIVDDDLFLNRPSSTSALFNEKRLVSTSSESAASDIEMNNNLRI